MFVHPFNFLPPSSQNHFKTLHTHTHTNPIKSSSESSSLSRSPHPKLLRSVVDSVFPLSNFSFSIFSRDAWEVLQPFELSAIDDLYDPYLINNTDSSDLILVSQPLTLENWNSWKRAILMALGGRNKLGFVDGTIPPPDPKDPLLSCTSSLPYFV